MEFTEDIYKNKLTGDFVRIVEKIVIVDGGEEHDGVIFVGIDSIKKAIRKIDFDQDYTLHKIGESIIG